MKQVIKRMGKRGEIVIPKDMRKELNLKPKEQVIIQSFQMGLLILPRKKRVKDLIGIIKTKHKLTREDELLGEFLLGGLEG